MAFCILTRMDEPGRLLEMTADCIEARCRGYPGKTVLKSYCAYLETIGDLVFGMRRTTLRLRFIELRKLPVQHRLELNGKNLPNDIIGREGGRTANLNSYADYLEQSIADQLVRLFPPEHLHSGVVNGVLNLASELLSELHVEFDFARKFRAAWINRHEKVGGNS